MALIFKEPLDLPPIPLPKEVWSEEDASNEAFYTAATLDSPDVEKTYTKVNQDLLSKGFSNLQKLAIDKYKDEQDNQNQIIVDSLIEDPSVSMQDKKNALELYATGGYISNDLKKRYQTNLLSPVNMASVDETETQVAALEDLDFKQKENNSVVAQEKVTEIDNEIVKVKSVDSQLPQLQIDTEVKEKIGKQVEILLKDIKDTVGVDSIFKEGIFEYPDINTPDFKLPNITLPNAPDLEGFSNVQETQLFDPGLGKDFMSLKQLELEGINAAEVATNMIKAVLSYGATGWDTYWDTNWQNYEKAKTKFKEQNKDMYEALPPKVQDWLSSTFDIKYAEEVIKRNSKTEDKVNIDYLQKYYNTEKGFAKTTWNKNANLAAKRLDPQNENYNPVYVENLETLRAIINNEGKYVFEAELLSLNNKHGIYSKHLNLALAPIYSAETTFGTNVKVSSGGAAGDLQVIHSTFKDLVKNGYLGERYVEAINDPLLINNVKDLKSLSKEDFISLMNNNKVAGVLAGYAKILQMTANNPTGFIDNVEVKGDLTKEGRKELQNTPKMKTLTELWSKNYESNDKFFGLTTPEENDSVLPDKGMIITKSPVKNLLAYLLPKAGFFDEVREKRNFTKEELESSPINFYINKTLGEGLHYLQEQLVEHGYAEGPGSARAMLDSALIFAPFLTGLVPKYKGKKPPGTEVLTKEQAYKDREINADLKDSNWRARYETSPDQQPMYGTPDGEMYTNRPDGIPPNSPLKATENANNKAATELAVEVINSEPGSKITKALGATKQDVFTSYVDFNYGQVGLGKQHPDLNNVPVESARDAREIFEEYKTGSETNQSIDYTFVMKVKEDINSLVNTTSNFSASHSRIPKVTNSSLNADLSFRTADGSPLIGINAAVDKFTSLVNNPNLNAINNINKRPGGTTKTAVGRKKGKIIYETNNFVDSRVYIRDLNSGEIYYSVDHINQVRKYLSPEEQILAGPPPSIDVYIPSYTQNGKKVPEKTITVPIKVGPTKKTRTIKLAPGINKFQKHYVDSDSVTLSDGTTLSGAEKFFESKLSGGVIVQDVNALLRRKADKSPHEILVDVKAINKTFNNKPWLNPKVPGVDPLPDIFISKEHWVDFVVKHEIAHAFNPRNPKAETAPEYENRINRIALNDFKEQFNKELSGQFEVMVEIRTDFDVLKNQLTPIEVSKLRMGFKNYGSFTFNPNTRIKNIDIYKYILAQQRDANWVNTELIDKALENSYLSQRVASLLVQKFTSYKNPTTLEYLLRRMYKEGRSINSYSNRELFNMFGPLINDPKMVKITGIKSIDDIPPLVEAADAFEQTAKLERAIKNAYERNRLEEEGFDKGVYRQGTNQNIAIVSTDVVSRRNKKLEDEVIRLQEDGSSIIETKTIDIPYITANVKTVYDLNADKVVPFEFDKELSNTSAQKGENFVYDKSGYILVKLNKPLNAGKQMLDNVYNIDTKKIEDKRDFGRGDQSEGSFIAETLPPVPGIDNYGYGLVDPSVLNLGALPTEILQYKDGYMPQIDQSLFFVDIIPMIAKDNGQVVYDYRKGKIDPQTFSLNPITASQLNTMTIFQKYSQAIARAESKKQANSIVRALEESGYYSDFKFRVRNARESDSKWTMSREESNQIVYEAELSSSKQFNKDIVGQPDIMDIGEALSRQVTNQLKQGLHTPAYMQFKKKFVDEFRDLLPFNRYPKNESEIGKGLDYNLLSKKDQARIDAAKNQFETYERRLGIQEAGLTDMAKQKTLHSLADIVEGFTNKAAPRIRREGNREATSSMLLQRAISTFVIAGSPLKQLILQLSPAIEAVGYKALGKDQFIAGAPAMMVQASVLRLVGILDHPSMRGQESWLESMIDTTLEKTGLSREEIPHLKREAKRTLSQIDKNILVAEIVTDNPVKLRETKIEKASRYGTNIVGAAGNIGRILGFKQSEALTSVMSVLLSRNVFNTNRPTEIWWESKNRAEVARRAYNYKGSMTVEGAMPWSRNMVSQLFTFMQYEHKIVIEVMSEGGFGMTDAQRARLLLSKGMLWGTGKLPIYGMMARFVLKELADLYEEKEIEELEEAGEENPEFIARQNKIDRLNSTLEANLADAFVRKVFEAAGYDAPQGTIVSESMSTSSFPFYRIGSEIYKYFDGNQMTEPSFAALTVPGRIMESVDEAKKIWLIPDGASGFENATTLKKTQETFNAFLKNYATASHIQKAILNQNNNYWILNKHGRKQIQISPEENVLIALGWGSDKLNTFYKSLYNSLDRKTIIEETAKLVHADYQRLVTQFNVGEKTLGQTKADLYDNMPWLLNSFAGAHKFNKKELQQIESLIYSLERQKAKETGNDALLDLIIKNGIQESKINSENAMDFMDQFGTDKDLKTILDNIE